MIYRCAVCKRMLCNRADFLTPGIPYVAKLDDDYACADCVRAHESDRHYAAVRGSRGTLGIALILESRMWESEDDSMANDWSGYCGRFGSILLTVDCEGNVDYTEYSTEDHAAKVFDDWYDDGMGAQEDDGYIESDGFRYHVSFNGKPLDVWAPRHTDEITMRRCIARIRLEAMRQGYYPNLWFVSDHGNLSRRDY